MSRTASATWQYPRGTWGYSATMQKSTGLSKKFVVDRRSSTIRNFVNVKSTPWKYRKIVNNLSKKILPQFLRALCALLEIGSELVDLDGSVVSESVNILIEWPALVVMTICCCVIFCFLPISIFMAIHCSAEFLSWHGYSFSLGMIVNVEFCLAYSSAVFVIYKVGYIATRSLILVKYIHRFYP